MKNFSFFPVRKVVDRINLFDEHGQPVLQVQLECGHILTYSTEKDRRMALDLDEQGCLLCRADELREHGLDSVFAPLTKAEEAAFINAISAVTSEAVNNRHKRPKLTTLVEEFAEMVLASRGKHDDPLELELKQIASVAVNILWQISIHGEDSISNLKTRRGESK